ncbi:S8 family serine peptidase [bacterium]|nr:S8 family serine peptidase [bacterium]
MVQFAIKYSLVAACLFSRLWISEALAADRPGSPQQTSRPCSDQVVVVKFKSFGLHKSAAARPAFSGIDRLEPILPQTMRLRKRTSSVGLERIYYAHFSDPRTPQEVAAVLQSDELVEYAEPKYIHRLLAIPNDSLIDAQLPYFNQIRLTQAWEIAKGENSTVVIAIVDGGTDIRHSDLAANVWQNPGEIPDNGKDDDGNGYIDDLHGWNFATNQPDPTGLANTPINAEHGTHTASICCAVTDNQRGLAGSSWNAKLLAVNCSSPYSDNSIISGYDGILYAAEAGADIINCSWGSLGGSSLYEQDVVNHALQLGSIIVAAAGNDNDSSLHYPSSYDGVLSVAALNNNAVRASYSNYGKSVDVAAPGNSLYGAISQNGYKTISGTSMASPLVAGVVALVKSYHPDWSNLQAAEQVRMTCADIDELNPKYAGKLGRGQVDAYAALTAITPSIRIQQVRYIDENEDGVIKPGERVRIYITLVNYLARADAIDLALTADSPFVELLSARTTLASLETLQKQEVATPFEIIVRPDAPRGHSIYFDLQARSGHYSDSDHFNLSVLPMFGNIEINALATSITSIGRIGFGQTDISQDGIGFKYNKGPNLLFEGAIMCGTGPDRLANAARGFIPPGESSIIYDADFVTADDGDLQFFTPGRHSDQESIGIFTDGKADHPMHLRIIQRTFADKEEALQNLIVFSYTIHNQGDETLTPFHFGFFFDWDIDGGHYNTNMVNYDRDHRLSYAYDTGAGPDTYVGIAVLDAVEVSSRAIYNDQKHPQNTSWGLYDGFTDEEKWQSLSGGTALSQAGPGDISHVISVGPLTLLPQNAVTLHFALMAGRSLADLQNTVERGNHFLLTRLTNDQPAQPADWELYANYPNPFNAATMITYQLPRGAAVRLEVFDLLGRHVKTLVDRVEPVGFHKVTWDGSNQQGLAMASGVYWCRLQAGSFSRSRKMLLIH